MTGLLEWPWASMEAWEESWTEPRLSFRARADFLLPVLPCLGKGGRHSVLVKWSPEGSVSFKWSCERALEILLMPLISIPLFRDVDFFCCDKKDFGYQGPWQYVVFGWL